MRAALAQLAVVEDEYLVGALDGREAVRDDDGGAVAEHPLDGLLDELLGLCVDGASGLVEDEERRSKASARANEMSCFWPTESPAPRSRTSDL